MFNPNTHPECPANGPGVCLRRPYRSFGCLRAEQPRSARRQRARIRLDGQVMHVLTQDGILWRTCPARSSPASDTDSRASASLDPTRCQNAI